MNKQNAFSEAIGALGLPDYENDGIAIYNRDCIAGMQALPAEVIDLTVTSPPYNIGKEYEATLALKDYLNWSERWIQAVHRATSFDGSFWLNLGYVPVESRARAIPLPYLLWDRIPFFLWFGYFTSGSLISSKLNVYVSGDFTYQRNFSLRGENACLAATPAP